MSTHSCETTHSSHLPKAEMLGDKDFTGGVIDLLTNDGRIYCVAANSGEPRFNLIYGAIDPIAHEFRSKDTPNSFDLFLEAHHDITHFTLGSPATDARHLPDHVLIEFLGTAISKTGRTPQEISLSIQAGTLTNTQVELIAHIGFKSLQRRGSGFQPEDGGTVSSKQLEWNNYFQAAQELIMRLRNGENVLEDDREYEEWGYLGSALLQCALVEEYKHELEAAYDILELTREFFIKAEKKAPSVRWELGKIDTFYRIEFAGCLAHLAACSDLKEYDRNYIPPQETNYRSRRQVLFDCAIDTYDSVATRIDPDDAGLRALVGSGKAHAYTLRGRYEDALIEGTEGRESSINQNFQIAIDELLNLIRELPAGKATLILRQQLGDVLDIQCGKHFKEGEELVANRELIRLTRLVLAGV